ncbi:Spore coat associated protein JA (CotJA), partial [Sporobacter termitidis DSM 10068]
AKPNTGMMPEMPTKPNTGMMPNTANQSNTGAMPYVAKPNIGAMPEMPAKPNTGMMPNTANQSNTGSMPYVAKPNIGAMPHMDNPKMGLMPEMMKPNAEADMTGCGYKNGELPPCAPLAAGFVPWQAKNSPKYESTEALTRGTLFPGLDLPFKDIANKTNPYAGTPLGDFMALGFVIKELNLYLDTHPNDRDALDMFQQLNKLMREGREKIVKMYGPQTIMDIMSGDKYTWIDNPWPWEYTEKGASDNNV